MTGVSSRIQLQKPIQHHTRMRSPIATKVVLVPVRHWATRHGSLYATRRASVRHFGIRSSSPSSPAAAPLLSGWDARWGFLERSLLRLPRLVSYQQQELFAPSLSILHHALLYFVLNAPQRVDLDLAEFLDGAGIATKRVLEDANSKAFVDFVKGTHNPHGHESVAKGMRSYCLPTCFQQLQASLRRLLATHQSFEALNVQIESACLTRAGYGRLTEQEYVDELRGISSPTAKRPQPTTHILTNRLSDDTQHATLERLQLQVEMRTCERMRRTETRPTSSTDHRHVSVIQQQRNVYVVRFTSRVTTHDELDWRLASIAVRTKGKPVELI